MTAPRSLRDLPGPRGLPLIGSAHKLHPERFHTILQQWSAEYGETYAMRVGRVPFLVTRNQETINAILRDRPDGYRRVSGLQTVLGEFTRNGVFSAEGDEWRRSRRIAVTALNSNHLARYFHIIHTATERLHARLQAAAVEGRTIEILEDLSCFTVDVTSALAFGIDLNTLEQGTSELQRHIHIVFSTLARRLIAPVQYWRWVRLPKDREAERSMIYLLDAVGGFVEQTRERMRQRPELQDAPENFLESMLAAQATEGQFTDDEIVGNTMTLLFAGEDTTSHTMAWTLWLVGQHPDVQERWAREAAAALGDDVVAPDPGVVERLAYGEAVLRESLRLKSVAPLGVVEPLDDVVVDGIALHKGTPIVLLTSLPGTLGQADFDPRRWLEDDDAVPVPDPKSFLTFGAGPRFCPGRNLAFLEAKCALATIARSFEVTLDPSAAPVTERFGFTMQPDGLRVRLRERAPVAVAA